MNQPQLITGGGFRWVHSANGLTQAAELRPQSFQLLGEKKKKSGEWRTCAQGRSTSPNVRFPSGLEEFLFRGSFCHGPGGTWGDLNPPNLGGATNRYSIPLPLLPHTTMEMPQKLPTEGAFLPSGRSLVCIISQYIPLEGFFYGGIQACAANDLFEKKCVDSH